MLIRYILFFSFLCSTLIAQTPVIPPTPPASQPTIPTPTVSETPEQQPVPVVTASPQTAAPIVAPAQQPQNPQPVAPVVTPPSQPVIPVATPASQPQNPQPIATTSPAQSGTGAAYEKDFEDLNQNLKEAANIKNSLKDIVKDINDKLINARKKVIETQKLGFEIMQKTQAEAEPLIAQASTDLQNLQNIQKNVESDLLPKFDGYAKKMSETIKKAQDKMTELQAKGLKFQAEQSQLVQKDESNIAVTPGKTGTQEAKAQPNINLAFYNKLKTSVINSVAGGIEVIQHSWKSLKKWALGSGSDVKKNLKSNMTAPNISLYAPENAERITDSFKAAHAHFVACDEIIKNVENLLNNTYQKYIEFKITISAIEKKLSYSQEFQEYKQEIEADNPWWKISLVKAFGTFLDFFIVMYAVTKKVAVNTYNYLFADFFSNFVTDVRNKIKKDEKETRADAPEAIQNNAPEMAPEMAKM